MSWSNPAVPPTAPPTLPPPGWYPDQRGGWAFWNGTAWLQPLATDVEPAAESAPRTWFPEVRPLAWPAALVGIGFITFLTIASQFSAASTGGVAAVVGLVLLALSTIGMPLVAVGASWKWGTRRIIDDLGLRVRWIDIPIGIASAIVLMITMVIVNLLSHAVGIPQGSNLTEISERGRDGFLFLTLLVLAGVIAPITEEILFRGLIQRGFGTRLTGWAPVVVQAVVFGAAHLTPSQGWGNVNLTLSLAVMGLGLGLLARLTGRLGTTMIAHAVFNCVQIGLLWLTLG